MKKKFTALVLALVASLTQANAIDIIWDFTYDTNNFFTQERRLVLDLVSDQFSNFTINSPDLANPSLINEGYYWDWRFSNPSTGLQVSEAGSLSAGTLVIYLGSRDLGGSLGVGGHAGSALYANQDWLNVYNTLNTEEVFMPFAGTVSLSNTYEWYSGLSDDVPEFQFDLFSVLTHEVAHVLGFTSGTYIKAWSSRIENGYFYGENAMDIYGGPIPLESGSYAHLSNSHFDNTEYSMTPYISSGTRVYFSDLEYAILQDLGYVMIPEPSTYALILGGVAVLHLIRKRRKNAFQAV